MAESSDRGSTHLTDENGKLPLWIKALYAVPRFTIRASYIIQSAYITYFYESIGARLTYIAAYVAIARSFDVITDPTMGWLTDNTRSSFGRRKPYMAAGTVIYNLMLFLLLNPPRTLEHPSVSHWFGLTYTLFFFADTFTTIPYFAFGMEMTNNFDERDQLWMWNALGGNLGTLIGMTMPAALTFAVTEDLYTVFLITSLMFIMVHVGGMTGNVALVQERPLEVHTEDARTAQEHAAAKPQTPEENAAAEPISAPFVVNLLRCMRNPPFDCIIRSYMLDYLSLGLVAAMVPFYCGYVLLEPKGGDTDDTAKTVVIIGYMAVFLFVAAFVSVPVWERVALKVGKYKAWIYYSIWNAITCPFFVICGHNQAAAFFVAFLNGSAFGGQFLLDSIVNDVAEYDTMLHGDSIEGSFVAIQTFVPKIVLVAALSLPFAVLVATGFKGSQCVVDEEGLARDDCDGDERAPRPQTDEIKWVILFFYCILPTLSALVSIHYKLQYPIKTAEQSTAISEAVSVHAKGKVARDPLTEQDVGPLCFCRVSDPARRRALWVLAHFPEASVRKLKENNGDAEFLVTRCRMQAWVSTALFVGSLVLAIVSFPWLDIDALAWIPIISCVAAGAFLVFVYVLNEINGQVAALKNGVVTMGDIDDYLGKLDGKLQSQVKDGGDGRGSGGGASSSIELGARTPSSSSSKLSEVSSPTAVRKPSGGGKKELLDKKDEDGSRI